MSRISRINAETAADKIAKPIEEKIKLAQKELTELACLIVSKEVPKEITQLFEKGNSYIKSEANAYFYGNGLNRRIYFEKQIPLVKDSFYPSKHDAERLVKAINKIENLKEEFQKTTSEITNTLLSLGSINNIQKSLPEAIPYIPMATNMQMVIAIKPVQDKIKKLVNQAK